MGKCLKGSHGDERLSTGNTVNDAVTVPRGDRRWLHWWGARNLIEQNRRVVHQKLM